MTVFQERLQKVSHLSGAENLREFIEGSEPKDFFHINVYKLADEWKLSRNKALDLFIQGTYAGLFNLEWEQHCPYCGGVPRESLTLMEELKSESHCPACSVDFNNTLDENIEVFFNITEEISSFPEELYNEYLASVSHDVEEKMMYDWQSEYTIKGIDCLQSKSFRELLGDQVLRLDQSLQIKHAAVMFTDIKGSTAMYEKLGDTAAYHLVRNHFNILFNAIERNGGVPIKTIGDAVMGVFTQADKSVKASFEILKEMESYNKTEQPGEDLHLKIGIHMGPAILVTLNGKPDYFGSTVNKAARIQGKAGAGELVISDEILNSKGVKRIITAFTPKVIRFNTEFRGISGIQTAYRAKINTKDTE